MIALEEALATVLAGCEPLSPQVVGLDRAGGCVLAGDDVVAAVAVPPFANSAMDGYAVRAADVAEVPVRLPVVAEVAAGHPVDRELRPGEAMRIFTGAPVPAGADAIVMVEETERLDGGSTVELRASPAPGQHVRPVGDDVTPGDVVATAGEELTPGRLGLLRSVGVFEVSVRPRPRVGVISTGDELVQGDEPLQPGQIRDTNRPVLLGLVELAGAVPVDLGHAPDDADAIRDALTAAAASCDAVITTGGVSMGDTDLVKVVLDELAGPGGMRWMQIAIRPAKPLAFGRVGGAGRADERRVPVFGLPGNPVSSMVSFELFARPGLRRLAGHPDDRLSRPRLAGVAAEPLRRRSDGKVQFVRVEASVHDGTIQVRIAGGQGSHQLSAMARANGLAVLPDGPGVDAGERVDVIVIGDLPA
ncbi:MAG TPA: gephyrin-like molybdotransferase Glp [Acidimicrobiales bacterium]|nr:gephyrin-like molybdotransferase Glp [Acidimicrobiales bacterium]